MVTYFLISLDKLESGSETTLFGPETPGFEDNSIYPEGFTLEYNDSNWDLQDKII